MSPRDREILNQIASDLATIMERVAREEREDLSPTVREVIGGLSIHAGALVLGGNSLKELHDSFRVVAMRGIARIEKGSKP